VAEVLEDSGTDDPERLAALARHWLAATRQADVTKAVYYARRAGQAALGAYAPADAGAWFSQALEVLDRHGAPEAERGRLLVELGIAQNAAGMPEHRQTLLDAAEIAQGLGDADLLVAAALGGRRGTGDISEADPERAVILQAALSGCYQFRAQPERSAERLAETAWACHTADRLGDPVLGHRARYQRIHACMEVGDLLEVDRRIEEMGSLVERTGLPFCRWQLLLTRTWRAILAGDLATGERLNDEALAVGSDIGAPEALGAWGTVLFHTRYLQGRTEELIEPFAQTAAENPAIDVLRVALASAYCSVGRLDEAAPLFEHDAATSFTEIPRDITWTTAMNHAQESAVVLEHREAAATIYDCSPPTATWCCSTTGHTKVHWPGPSGA
jgi:hypothetical protein